MASSAINKYLIEPDTYDLFNNIAQFMKNAEVKIGSEKIYNGENAYSKDFGRLLVKYFEEKLTNDDINTLLELTTAYNDAITEYWKENSVNKNILIWGFTTNAEDIEKFSINTSSCLFKRFIEKYNNSNYNINYIIKKFNIDNENDFELVQTIYDVDAEYVGEDYTAENKKDIDSDFDKIEAYIQEKDLIICHVSTDNTNYEKRSASAEETTWAEKGEYLTFFDLQGISVSADDALYSNPLIENASAASARNLFSGDIAGTYNILVQYKELNSYYRKILNSNLWDNAQQLLELEMDADNSKELSTTFFKKYTTQNQGTIINSVLHTEIRSNAGDGILVRDGYTSSRYKYFYGNPYTARVSSESSIIGYYYGDNYAELSNGYGQYLYQRNEIMKFLDIYEETRDYYYRVLLNKSFINESFYPVYEKSFIAFTAIARFLDSKIDLLRDIESLDRTDISNFMQSYGLKELDDKLKDGGEFLKQEYYLRKILHNFVDLIKIKGSKAIINKLIEIFDYGDDEISINKFLIYDNAYSDIEYTSGTNRVTETPNRRVHFVELPYFSNTDNMTNDINSAIEKNATSYSEFFSKNDDIYWDTGKVAEKDIINANLSVSETKYLSLKLSENMSENYIKTRYIFSIMDQITGDMDLPDETLCRFKLAQLLLYALYIGYGQGASSESNGSYWWINTANLIDDFNNGVSEVSQLNEYIEVKDGELSLKTDSSGSLVAHHFGNNLSASSTDTIRGIVSRLNLLHALITNAANVEDLYRDVLNNHSATYSKESAVALVLEFPIGYLSGEYTEQTSFNAEFYDFIEALFNRYFTVSADYDPLYPSSAEFSNAAYTVLKENYLQSLDEKLFSITAEENNTILAINADAIASGSIDAISNAVISIINDLRDTFTENDSLQIYISLNESIQRQMDFMSDVIDYFISYTTQVINSQFIRNYNNSAERCPVYDGFSIEHSDVRVEMAYYDEKFAIEEEITNETTE